MRLCAGGPSSVTSSSPLNVTPMTTIIDRLVLGGIYRKLVCLLSAAFFFELADLSTFTCAAPAFK